jgi:hypothetical protein
MPIGEGEGEVEGEGEGEGIQRASAVFPQWPTPARLRNTRDLVAH